MYNWACSCPHFHVCGWFFFVALKVKQTMDLHISLTNADTTSCNTVHQNHYPSCLTLSGGWWTHQEQEPQDRWTHLVGGPCLLHMCSSLHWLVLQLCWVIWSPIRHWDPTGQYSWVVTYGAIMVASISIPQEWWPTTALQCIALHCTALQFIATNCTVLMSGISGGI